LLQKILFTATLRFWQRHLWLQKTIFLVVNEKKWRGSQHLIEVGLPLPLCAIIGIFFKKIQFGIKTNLFEDINSTVYYIFVGVKYLVYLFLSILN
jgi:hypothetical protein